MKNLLTKYPFLKTVIAFILGSIATYFGINADLPINHITKVNSIDSVSVVIDSIKVDSINNK